MWIWWNSSHRTVSEQVPLLILSCAQTLPLLAALNKFRFVWWSINCNRCPRLCTPTCTRCLSKTPTLVATITNSKVLDCVCSIHGVAVALYADHAPALLLPFLRQSTYYRLEKAYAACVERKLYREQVRAAGQVDHWHWWQVFILGRMGDTKKALSLIMQQIGDVKQAIEFVVEHSSGTYHGPVRCSLVDLSAAVTGSTAMNAEDDELWEDLIQLRYAQHRCRSQCCAVWSRPSTLASCSSTLAVASTRCAWSSECPTVRGARGGVCSASGARAGMAIDGLRDLLVKIIADYSLQCRLRAGCNSILKSDCVSLYAKLHASYRCVDGGWCAPARLMVVLGAVARLSRAKSVRCVCWAWTCTRAIPTSTMQPIPTTPTTTRATPTTPTARRKATTMIRRTLARPFGWLPPARAICLNVACSSAMEQQSDAVVAFWCNHLYHERCLRTQVAMHLGPNEQMDKLCCTICQNLSDTRRAKKRNARKIQLKWNGATRATQNMAFWFYWIEKKYKKSRANFG